MSKPGSAICDYIVRQPAVGVGALLALLVGAEFTCIYAMYPHRHHLPPHGDLSRRLPSTFSLTEP